MINFEREFSVGYKDKSYFSVKKLSDVILNLQYWFDELNKKLDKAEKENERLKSENYKDEELTMMAEKVRTAEEKADRYWRESRYGFPMTKEERDEIRAWKKNHDSIIHGNPSMYHGASGGGYTYEFYPTGIGTAGYCVCDTCRRRAYDSAYSEGKFDRKKYRQYMSENDGYFQFKELG